MNSYDLLCSIALANPEYIQAAGKPRKRHWGRWVAVAAVFCLVMLVGIPALAANFSGLYDTLYAISPATAQRFKRIQMTSEEAAIEKITINGNTAEVCISMEGASQAELDRAAIEYRVYSGKDCVNRCEVLSYDPALLLITIESSAPIDGGKITVSLKAHTPPLTFSPADYESMRFTEMPHGTAPVEPESPLDTTADEPQAPLFPGDIECFEDLKTTVYNRMLNAIDHYNHLDLTLETSMLREGTCTVLYQADINATCAYEALYDGGLLVTERYTNPDGTVTVDHRESTVCYGPLGLVSREDSPYIPLASKITVGADGVPCYHRRQDITGCPLSSLSIFPQDIAFSFLKDFARWDIVDGDSTYLGRPCVIIKGTPSSYTGEKADMDNFILVVDLETGVLLDLVGTRNNNITRFIHVTSCNFEGDSANKTFDPEDYPTFELP